MLNDYSLKVFEQKRYSVSLFFYKNLEFELNYCNN